MNVRLTILLVFVLVVFGGTFLWFQFNPAEERIPPQPWLYKIDDNSIVHIEVTHAGQTGTYDKKAGGTTWYIQDADQEYPVFLEKWSGTPLLLSGPQVNRVLAQSFENPATYGLDPPESVVKVTERSGITFEFHMGDPTPDGEHQYATLIGDPKLFTLPQIWAEVINRLATEPPYIRLYYIGADSSIYSIGVEHNGHYVEYQSQSRGLPWVIAVDGAEDTGTPVSQDLWPDILRSLTTPPVSQILADKIDNPGDFGLENPQTRVDVVTLREDPFVFFLGDPTEDGLGRYAQRRGRQELYSVPASWARMVEGLTTEPPYAAGNAEEPTPPG
jgi:hypothetical protein